ncbi:MAG: hypothetical protein Q4C91_21045 [Eubacteriales bacterium]|nr:hypothetical protein [Eubacteriales bacterium]
MKKRMRLIALGIATGVLVSSTSVPAYTLEYTFHMNTSYAHGKDPNCGYAASKDDNEQKAYITMTRFQKSDGSPTISMWVAPSGSYTELTTAWSWTSTAPRKPLDYYPYVYAGKGDVNQLCAEQFGGGSVVIGGKWTP